jgi:DNA invertase Pin-like site-specific DNA recombinase
MVRRAGMLSKEGFYVLRHYLSEGVSKTAVAKKLGISRITVYSHSTGDKAGPGYGPRQPEW